MKRRWKVFREILMWCVVLLALVTVAVTLTTARKPDRSFFGWRAFVVLSDSMKATDFDAGDVVLVKKVNPETLRPGDIIAFRSADPDCFGDTITHKIRSVERTADGEAAFVTYGTTTGVDDRWTVSYENVIGKYLFHIPKIGWFFQFLKTVPGYFPCVFLPLLSLLLLQIGRDRKWILTISLLVTGVMMAVTAWVIESYGWFYDTVSTGAMHLGSCKLGVQICSASNADPEAVEAGDVYHLGKGEYTVFLTPTDSNADGYCIVEIASGSSAGEGTYYFLWDEGEPRKYEMELAGDAEISFEACWGEPEDHENWENMKAISEMDEDDEEN